MDLNLEQPLVSVIIPSYNAARYVRDAVESARAQTYQHLEIVVVDDGSTDDTREVLSPFITAGDIHYIYQENRGLSGARNAGISAARGEFIALLDADDMFLSEKIERQVGYFKMHPECDICYCDVFHFYEDKPDTLLHLQYEYYSSNDVFPQLLKKNFINPLTTVIRRNVFGDVGYFDEEMKQYAEDWDFWLRAAYAGKKIEHFPEVLAKYRMRKGSISYNRALEVTRKKTILKIFRRLDQKMSADDRARYHMSAILKRHTMRLWYAELAERIPFFAWLHRIIQQKRLKSA